MNTLLAMVIVTTGGMKNMDGSRFDEVTRRFVTARSRRGVLAAALAALGGGLSVATVAARPRPKHRNVCRALGDGCTRDSQCCDGPCNVGRHLPRSQRNRCGCPGGNSLCEGACVDLASSDAHCGDCGNACVSGDQACCSGACIDVSADEDNCGSCGTTCDTVNGETCASGQCVCDTDLTECSGACVDTSTDLENCGDCGIACNQINFETCIDGGCCGMLTAPCTVDADCCDTTSVGCFYGNTGSGFMNLCLKRQGVACSYDYECYDGECDGGVCVAD